jgi:hypothetical protein
MKRLIFGLLLIFLVLGGCGNNSYAAPNDINAVDKRGSNSGSLPISFWLSSNLESINISTVAGEVLGAYWFVTDLNLLDDPTDFWQTSQETLNRGGGDCEDLSFLLASLLLSRGIDSVVAIGTFDGDGHMWVEVDGKIYETTKFILPFSIEEGNKFGYIPKIKVLVR